MRSYAWLSSHQQPFLLCALLQMCFNFPTLTKIVAVGCFYPSRCIYDCSASSPASPPHISSILSLLLSPLTPCFLLLFFSVAFPCNPPPQINPRFMPFWFIPIKTRIGLCPSFLGHSLTHMQESELTQCIPTLCQAQLHPFCQPPPQNLWLSCIKLRQRSAIP